MTDETFEELFPSLKDNEWVTDDHAEIVYDDLKRELMKNCKDKAKLIDDLKKHFNIDKESNKVSLAAFECLLENIGAK